MGLRSNDHEVCGLLRRGLAPHVIEDVEVFPNLSLYRGDERGGTRELHRLYRRGATIVRTPSVGQLVRAAARALDTFLTPPEGLVRNDGASHLARAVSWPVV